ncbi:DUF4124 domain-containing protein [Rhodoferax sp. WC2427]|uniref:DUF4124 domain-containing protein n=1 Tax=Rhodoferax sp. WC2427 TaxID=3234144 RepID=UPI0034678C9F
MKAQLGGRTLRRSVLMMLLALVPPFFSGLAWADIFKCTDASGKLSFSDRPCEGSKRESVDLRYRGTAAPLSATSAASTLTQASTPSTPSPISSGPPTSQLTPVKPPETPLAERLAALCVDVYRAHLAYPQGVRIVSQILEKSLSEYLITVQVKTISNPATPARIDPIVIDEKFICVTDGGSGLNARSTDMYVKRHKDGQRL